MVTEFIEVLRISDSHNFSKAKVGSLRSREKPRDKRFTQLLKNKSWFSEDPERNLGISDSHNFENKSWFSENPERNLGISDSHNF